MMTECNQPSFAADKLFNSGLEINLATANDELLQLLCTEKAHNHVT
jgi:hypothetical protein